MNRLIAASLTLVLMGTATAALSGSGIAKMPPPDEPEPRLLAQMPEPDEPDFPDDQEMVLPDEPEMVLPDEPEMVVPDEPGGMASPVWESDLPGVVVIDDGELTAAEKAELSRFINDQLGRDLLFLTPATAEDESR